MMNFSLYFRILLSLSLSFLLHAFKKHIHYFFGLATAFKSANNATDNYQIHLKCNHRVLDSSTAAKPAPPPPPPPSPIGFVDDIGGYEIDGFMSCTESLGFESIDERRVDDQIDDANDNDHNDDDKDEDEDECWRMTRAADGRGNLRKVKSFPPPLSSLDGNGQRSFSLVAVRQNGRLQLNVVRIKRPEIMYASREDGRLRLYLVPDLDDAEEEEHEEEEEKEEIVEEDVTEKTEEEIIVESESEEEEEDEMVEEIIRNEQQDTVGEWKFPIGGNEGFRRCHQVVNQIHHHHVIHSSHHHHNHNHHHLRMYGIGIA